MTLSYRRASALGGCALMVLAGTPWSAANAQSVAQDASALVPGAGDIIVTAQRRAERLTDVPLTVAAVSGQALEKAGVTTLRDVQTVIPGFTYGAQAVVPQPAIRGVSTFVQVNGSENPNALYVDGIYSGVPAVLSNDLPDLDHIEVLKGPQGTLFGRNATGGAIQLFTKGPSFTPHASVTIDGSAYTGDGTSRSAPRMDVRAFVTGPIVSNAVAASLSAGYDYSPGFVNDDVTGERGGMWRRATLRGKLLIKPTSNLSITAAGFYIQNNNEQGAASTPYKGLSAARFYAGSVIPSEPWHTAFFDGYPGAFLKQYGASLKVELQIDPGTFTLLSGYTKTKGDAFNSTSAAAGSLTCLARFVCLDVNQKTKTREISEELNFVSRKIGILSFTAGMFYYNSNAGNDAFIQKPIIPAGQRIQGALARTRAYAAYGEATINPFDPFFITVGLRQSHERHDDSAFSPIVVQRARSFNATTPRVSLRYEMTPNLNVYGTFSIGYKGGLTGVTNTGNGFAPVAPEKIYSYEAGVKYADRFFSTNLSFFYYDYKNKQEQAFTGTTVIIENTGPVRIYGVDADARLKIDRDLTLLGGLSWIPVAKYRDFPGAFGYSTVQGLTGAFLPGIGNTVSPSFNATGMRLTRAPKFTGSLTLSYEHKMEAGTLDASTTLYYSSQVLHDITGLVRQPAYATLNAQAGYTFGTSGFRLGVFGRNLSNKAYVSGALTSSAGFWVAYAPPRELGVSIGYNF